MVDGIPNRRCVAAQTETAFIALCSYFQRERAALMSNQPGQKVLASQNVALIVARHDDFGHAPLRALFDHDFNGFLLI